MLTVAVFASFKALLDKVVIVLPSQFTHAMTLIIPDNLFVCLSLIVSAHVIKWVWMMKLYFLEIYVGK